MPAIDRSASTYLHVVSLAVKVTTEAEPGSV